MPSHEKKLISLLKKFPDQNPNPVIRLSQNGILEYYNSPSKEIIKYYGLKLENKINDFFLNHLNYTILKKEHSFEIQLKKSSFHFNAIYIKELKSVNIYGTDITAKKLIDKFPDSNPNPVIRIDSSGKLSYFNEASNYLVKELDLKVNILMPDQIMNKILKGQQNFELTVGSKVFLFNVVKIEEFNFFLMYGTDITDTKDKEKILNKLSKYFSPQVYSSIFSGELDVTINTSRKDLTVFFSDIKSFTTITEKLEPEVLTKLITNYLTAMTDIAIEYGGTVDKYIGDAIMIFFGDPKSDGVKRDAISCVRMAMEMLTRLTIIKKKWKHQGITDDLAIRIGIHSDICTVGNFGSKDRLDYTVLGNGVNLASRLEGLADPNSVLISENTFNIVKKEIDCEMSDEVTVKGKLHPVKTYKVRGLSMNKQSSEILMEDRGFLLNIDENIIEDKDAVIKKLEQSVKKLKAKKSERK